MKECQFEGVAYSGKMTLGYVWFGKNEENRCIHVQHRLVSLEKIVLIRNQSEQFVIPSRQSETLTVIIRQGILQPIVRCYEIIGSYQSRTIVARFMIKIYKSLQTSV